MEGRGDEIWTTLLAGAEGNRGGVILESSLNLSRYYLLWRRNQSWRGGKQADSGQCSKCRENARRIGTEHS